MRPPHRKTYKQKFARTKIITYRLQHSCREDVEVQISQGAETQIDLKTNADPSKVHSDVSLISWMSTERKKIKVVTS